MPVGMRRMIMHDQAIFSFMQTFWITNFLGHVRWPRKDNTVPGTLYEFVKLYAGSTDAENRKEILKNLHFRTHTRTRVSFCYLHGTSSPYGHTTHLHCLFPAINFPAYEDIFYLGITETPKGGVPAPFLFLPILPAPFLRFFLLFSGCFTHSREPEVGCS